MTYQFRIGARPARSRSRLLTEGVASIDLNQRIVLGRKAIAKGSLAGDWKAVGEDLRNAVNGIKREFETT